MTSDVSARTDWLMTLPMRKLTISSLEQILFRSEDQSPEEQIADVPRGHQGLQISVHRREERQTLPKGPAFSVSEGLGRMANIPLVC